MSSTPTGLPTILIVDDHADTRELLTMVFEEAGFVVCEAGTVDEAIKCLQEEVTPALILSDIAMPGATGEEFIAYLRRDATLRTIPVIVLTGRQLTEVTVAAQAVFRKPVDPYALLKTAREVLEVSG